MNNKLHTILFVLGLVLMFPFYVKGQSTEYPLTGMSYRNIKDFYDVEIEKGAKLPTRPTDPGFVKLPEIEGNTNHYAYFYDFGDKTTISALELAKFLNLKPKDSKYRTISGTDFQNEDYYKNGKFEINGQPIETVTVAMTTGGNYNWSVMPVGTADDGNGGQNTFTSISSSISTLSSGWFKVNSPIRDKEDREMKFVKGAFYTPHLTVHKGKSSESSSDSEKNQIVILVVGVDIRPPKLQLEQTLKSMGMTSDCNRISPLDIEKNINIKNIKVRDNVNKASFLENKTDYIYDIKIFSRDTETSYTPKQLQELATGNDKAKYLDKEYYMSVTLKDEAGNTTVSKDVTFTISEKTDTDSSIEAPKVENVLKGATEIPVIYPENSNIRKISVILPDNSSIEMYKDDTNWYLYNDTNKTPLTHDSSKREIKVPVSSDKTANVGEKIKAKAYNYSCGVSTEGVGTIINVESTVDKVYINPNLRLRALK